MKQFHKCDNLRTTAISYQQKGKSPLHLNKSAPSRGMASELLFLVEMLSVTLHYNVNPPSKPLFPSLNYYH